MFMVNCCVDFLYNLFHRVEKKMLPIAWQGTRKRFVNLHDTSLFVMLFNATPKRS